MEVGSFLSAAGDHFLFTAEVQAVYQPAVIGSPIGRRPGQGLDGIGRHCK